MSPNSIRELTCRPCGQSFMGKKGSRVCGECQARRKAAAQRRYYEKHRQHRELCSRVTRAEERVDELGKIMAAYMERERSRDAVIVAYGFDDFVRKFQAIKEMVT